MSGNFSIGANSIKGLGSSLVDGTCTVKKDLALVKSESGQWKLIDLRKEEAPLDGTVIRGKALVGLMQAVANSAKDRPATLSATLAEKEFKNLTQDSKFRNFCRIVPGMETPEHIQSRSRNSEALQRSVSAAKVIGKGLNASEGLGLEARYVGQDNEKHMYWIREVVMHGSNKPYREIEILVSGWELNKTSNLSITEWESGKREEWQKLGTDQEFLPWLATQVWDKKEKNAWKAAHPNQLFDEAAFSMWRNTQTDPDLFLPTWLLKEISGKNNETDFQTWKAAMIPRRKEDWERFKKDTGATNLSFEDHERMDFKHSISGLTFGPEQYIMRQLWEQAKTSAISPTQDDFTTFVRRLKFNEENPGPTTEAEFAEWNVAQEQKLHQRYEGTHLPLSFEEWKSQQYDGILIDPAPFILLGDKERQIYRTTCSAGHLERNAHPFNTEFDKTRHSGEGYAIFVIGPDQDLYCGSHILGVFHHSSFLGEGATVAAGEVKTNPDGSIAELSSKSGHYQPTESQNLYMLRYFRDRGVDLSTVKFTAFGAGGTTVERDDALEYMKELEYIESLGNLDKIDPTIFQ